MESETPERTVMIRPLKAFHSPATLIQPQQREGGWVCVIVLSPQPRFGENLKSVPCILNSASDTVSIPEHAPQRVMARRLGNQGLKVRNTVAGLASSNQRKGLNSIQNGPIMTPCTGLRDERDCRFWSAGQILMPT